MQNTNSSQVTYISIFEDAIKAKKLSVIKELLKQFGVPGNDVMIHNLALNVITDQGGKGYVYNIHLQNARNKMAETKLN